MKAKFLIILIITAFSFTLTACSYQLSFNLNKSSSKMSCKTDTVLTKTYKSNYSFKKGDVIPFKYSSDINSGELDMEIIDSENNSVFSFKTNKTGKEAIKISKNDTYTIIADCKNFIGNYNIEWTK